MIFRQSQEVTPTSGDVEVTLPKAFGLYVGVGGDVVVQLSRDEDSVTFQNVQSGTVLPIRIRAVKQSGTTAQGLLVLGS